MLGYLQTWRKKLGAISLSLVVSAALALICGYAVYSLWLSVQPFAGQTVNLAGRQRALAQQIAKDTLMLVQEPSVERRLRLRQSTHEAAAQFARVQQGFVRGDKSLGISGVNTANVRRALVQMDPAARLLTGSVETINGLGADDLMRLSIAAPEVQGMLGAVEALALNYDDFIRDYIAGAERQEVRHNVLEIGVYVAAFLVLLHAQLLSRRLNRQMERLGAGMGGRSRMLRREILARRHSEEQHRLLIAAVEQAFESFVITDASGTILYVNPAFLRNTGYSREEILGQNPRILKSGKQDPEFYRRLWSTINSGEAWQGQMINRRKDGTLCTEAEAIFPIRDQNSRIRHFAAIKHDITREIEMEKQLRESQRLEAIGVLAGGIAHDFNNILTPIIGFTTLTLDLVPWKSEAHYNLGMILSAANRAKDLVMEIRNGVRQSKDPAQAIKLQAITQQVLNLIRSTAAKSIEIVQDIPAQLPAVRGEPSDAHRLLMNLCVNACQAMPEGGQLGISLRSVKLTETAGYLGDPAPGDFVRIEVKDSGHGMSEETQAHVFEPYFTTRQNSTGTGLGLFLVFNIVKQLQ